MTDPCIDAPLITGIGLRLPGARGLDQAWRVMAEGRCTVTTVSPRGFDPEAYFDPQPGRRGKAYTFAAGQLDRLFHFDAGFFGISPREAAEMDPQQRLMLVSTWEAVEDAGLNMADLAGPRTGVFVGASIVENLPPYYFDTARGGSGFTLGNTLGIIANRVSATFDFSGPSQVVDTACSSGLTALDMAVGALRRGALDSAIVGAVHVVRAPGGFVGFSQARMLSPDGLCRAFDAAANGYVRSEASIALLLQRPEVAMRMHARRRARVLATGVNTDGAASPLVVPSPARQQALLDTALTASTRDPDDFHFYEAHGTGTPVGDPAEAASISGGLACLRRNPLPIGSAKTNFGHAEPAAGLVGVVKAVLAMDRRALPASLHFETPNPAIDFEGLNLSVNTALSALPDGALLAGVNAFGFGGTNAVAILESVTVPASSRRKPPDASPWLMLSAASGPSLECLAAAWADKLSDTPVKAHPALAAAAARRAELPFRLALELGPDAPGLLRGFASGARNVSHGRAPLGRPRSVFAFAGNGAQHAGMGRAEYRSDPVFRAAFDQVAQAFGDQGLAGLARLLDAPDLDAQLQSPLVAQPLLVACQIARVASLKAAGIRPDAVIGHSLGELTALHVAGVIDLSALALVVASRSRAFEGLRGRGTMATVALAEEEAQRALAGLGCASLCIAAVNGPRSVTVSGPAEGLDRLARITVAGRRIAMVRLGVDLPYHSAALDPLRDQFLADVAAVRFQAPTLPLASATLGRMLRPTEANADYLWRNSRDTVRFSDALISLTDTDPLQVVELSPRAVLGGNIRDMARHHGLSLAHFAATGGQETAQQTAARAWLSGVRIDRRTLAGTCHAAPADLPPYPWDEAEHCTLPSPDGFDAWGEAGPKGFCGRRPDRETPVWTAEFTPSHPSWLCDHRFDDQQILPAAALAEAALSAGAQLWPDAVLELADFDILSPVEVAGEGVRLRTRIAPETGVVTLAVRARLMLSDWAVVARGTLRKTARDRPKPAPPGPVRGSDAAPIYAALSARGLHYGAAFQRLASVACGRNGTAFASLGPPVVMQSFALDPTALDGAFHALAALIAKDGGLHKAPAELQAALAQGAALLPTRMGRLTLWQRACPATHARLIPGRVRRRSLELDLLLFAADGSVIAQIEQAEFTIRHLHRSPIKPARFVRRRVRTAFGGQRVAAKGWANPATALKRLGFEKTPRLGAAAQAFAQFQNACETGLDVQPTLASLLQTAPDLADQARLLLAARSGSPLYDVVQFNGQTRAAWGRAAAMLQDLLRRWPARRRCTVLLVGLPSRVDVEQLADDARIDQLRLTHPEEEARNALRRALPDHLRPLVIDAPASGQWGVVLSVDTDMAARPAALAPGGIALHLDRSAQPETGAWFGTAGQLPLRIRCSHSTAETKPAFGMPRLVLRGLLPPDLPADLCNAVSPDDADLAVLPFILQPEHKADLALAAALSALRQAVGDTSVPLCIVAIDRGAAQEFAQFAAGLSAAVTTLANEVPDLRPGLVVLHAGAQPDWSAIFAASGADPVLHVQADGIWAERLEPLRAPPLSAPALALAQGGQAQLEWQRKSRRRPRKDEAEVKVLATGLNFRDAMLVRGLLPERILEGGASKAGLGMEFSGRVLRAGEGAEFPVGTTVMGFAADGFTTHLTLPTAMLARVPDGADPLSAAAWPVAFVTAWEALVNVARLTRGEVALIHGGAGGVGLAAIQVARLHGARVFATASTPERRALACAAGAEAAFDSRTTGFADAVMAQTGGRGVDVVLNSLSDAAMQRSAECLAPFGRFVELGKRDFLEGTRLDLRSFARQLGYFAFDLDQRLLHAPKAMAQTMAKVCGALDAGRLFPLPVTALPAPELGAGLAHMLAGRHVGKLVAMPPDLRPARRGRSQPLRGDWVILGGTGGVGLALARTLVNAGVTRVHLLSRSGTASLGNGAAARWAMGCPQVLFHPVDCADDAALGAFLSGAATATGRLGGVIHAAMDLRDRPLRDLDLVEARQVIRAKLGVARTLDRVLRGQDMQPENVLFLSSVAARIGNPGQAAYAAANAAVEALAKTRRDDGLPAQVLALGPIGDAGVLVRRGALAAQLSRLGGVDLMPMQTVATEVLSALQNPPAKDYLYAAMDWAKLAAHLPALGSANFSPLVPEGAADTRSAGALAQELKTLEWPAALARMTHELTVILCQILRLAPEDFDRTRPLGRYGIDSLMAMELRLEVEKNLGLNLATLPFSADTTTARLATLLLARLRQDADA